MRVVVNASNKVWAAKKIGWAAMSVSSQPHCTDPCVESRPVQIAGTVTHSSPESCPKPLLTDTRTCAVAPSGQQVADDAAAVQDAHQLVTWALHLEEQKRGKGTGDRTVTLSRQVRAAGEPQEL